LNSSDLAEHSVAEFLTRSATETVALGNALAKALPHGPTLLIGDLGAGKTTLVKGVAGALLSLAENEVSSPTFSLVHEYGDPVRLMHLDLYRLESPEEALGIGIEEMMDKPWPMLIEWGDRFPELWPPGTPRIIIERLDESQRRVRVEGLAL
jgi:tRNA threonylcarbamoyladenosine biosynthesis protein TsaE